MAIVLSVVPGMVRTAVSAEVWSPPVQVSSEVTAVNARPRTATDEKGRFTTVWQRQANGQTLYSRSTNYGATWTPALDLPNPAGNFNSFGTPAVAGDITSSTFMAAWPVDPPLDPSPHDIALARAGLTESNYASIGRLPYNGNSDYAGLLLPAIESGGNRVWITAGSTLNGAGDEALAIMRTADDGENWTFQGLLGTSNGPVQADRNVALARDRANNAWVAVWERRLGSVDSSNIEVLFSRSADNGLTWAAPAALNSAAPAGAQPTVASPVNTAFVAAYVNGSGPGSIKAKRSADAGATWGTPIEVNVEGADGHGTAVDPHLASDGQGNLVMVWAGNTASRRKLYYSTSENAGLTWTAADVLTTASAGDISDLAPHVRYDGNGKWVTVWHRTRAGSGTGHQIMASSLVFPIRADLSVTQVDTPDPAKVGQQVTYKMTVRNRGPIDATGVVLTCTPPTTNTITISATDGVTHETTSETIVFTIGDLGVNKTVEAEFTVLMERTGNFQNIAVLTSNEADIDVEDRTSVERTVVLIEGIDLQGTWSSFIYKVPRRIERGRLYIDATLDYSNFGTKRARAGIITWYLSDDEFLSDDDAFAGRRHVDMLLRGRTRQIKFTKLMSRYIPWENRYLIAILDSEKRITEAEPDGENNNVVMSERLLVPNGVIE